MNHHPDLSRPLLAIDTSTPAASAALRCQGIITAECHQGHAKHTEVLLPMIDRLLQAAGLNIADLGGIIISAGPGAFTGLRVGASMAAGLAAAYDTPLGCLSSLALLAAAAAPTEDSTVLALMDARMRQHYAALYEYRGGSWQLAAEEGLFFAQDLPSPWLEAADNVMVSGDNYVADKIAHLPQQQAVPQARDAFSALNLCRWQSPQQAIDLQYLRNEITG